MKTMATVKALKEASKYNRPFSGTYVISRCNLKPFKTKPGFFMNCELTDQTGAIKGIIWDNAENVKKKIRNKMIVSIRGETTLYNGVPQAVIKYVDEEKEYDRDLFVPALSSERQEELIKHLKLINEEHIKDPFYKTLWSYILNTTDSGAPAQRSITKKFRECPGGVGDVHHAYIGGLMEHSFSMIWAGLNYANLPNTDNLDKELLLTGCLIHDIGKILTYAWDIVIEMKDLGRLAHHVPLGTMVLTNIVWRDLSTEDTEENNIKYNNLMHIIVSHHDATEGHRLPMTPEAVAVSRLDAMDAAVVHAANFTSNADNHELDTNWTKYNQLTGRRYYSPVDNTKEIPEPEPTKKKETITEDGAF